VLLAWSLLHSHAITWLGRGIDRLETRARQNPDPTAARTWLSHLVAAGLVFVLCRGVGGWATGLWARDAWIFPNSGRSLFLGVDWYFLSVANTVRASEIAILLVFALVAGPLIARSLERDAPERESA
jgi:hypothetical protein